MSEPQVPQLDHGHETMPAHGGHGWMMIACCIPMLVLAVILVATGIASAGFLLAALACTAMMAMMMRAMGGTTSGRES
jgi:hypothetical protein